MITFMRPVVVVVVCLFVDELSAIHRFVLFLEREKRKQKRDVLVISWLSSSEPSDDYYYFSLHLVNYLNISSCKL